MRVIPAIDLVDGRPVRLAEGDSSRMTSYGLSALDAAKRFEDGGARDQNARIADLFSRLDLSARFVGRDRLAEAATLALPDYAAVDGRLSRLRKESLDYLSGALANKR